MGFFSRFSSPSLELSPLKIPLARGGKAHGGISGVSEVVRDSLEQNPLVIFPELIRIPWITKGWHPWANGFAASWISGDPGSVSLDKILNPPEFHGPCSWGGLKELGREVVVPKIAVKYWDWYQILGILSSIGNIIKYRDCYQILGLSSKDFSLSKLPVLRFFQFSAPLLLLFFELLLELSFPPNLRFSPRAF